MIAQSGHPNLECALVGILETPGLSIGELERGVCERGAQEGAGRGGERGAPHRAELKLDMLSPTLSDVMGVGPARMRIKMGRGWGDQCG